MTYIYCDVCAIGLHSNVTTCPQCGARVRRAYGSDPATHHRRRRRHEQKRPTREDVESEVREAIYGWRSGTVAVERIAGR